MSNNLITVVIVCFNASETIEMSMLSVLSQRKDNLELLIVDGVSTDGTVDIINRYKRRVENDEFSGKSLNFISEIDCGIYDAMNKGIDLASGDWLFFLGADDILLPMFSDACAVIARQDTIYYCNTFLNKHQFVYAGKFNQYKLGVKNICHQTIFYPKHVLRKYYYDTDYQLNADYLFNIICYSDKQINFSYIPIVISVFNEYGSCNTKCDNKFNNDKFTILRTQLGITTALYSCVYSFIRRCVKIVLNSISLKK